jgi:hypothetical protein
MALVVLVSGEVGEVILVVVVFAVIDIERVDWVAVPVLVSSGVDRLVFLGLVVRSCVLSS